jgi:acyl CoA:acetate/3-ketoacid CoA transferase beta subunit
MCINLGIGMPTLVPMFVPDEYNITMHVENGMLGVGGFPEPGEEDADLINPEKQTVIVLIIY